MIATVQAEAPHTLYEQTARTRLQAILTDSPPWLQDLRLKALSRFEFLGFPTRRLEAWKYINVRPLLSQPFQAHAEAVAVDPADLQPHLLGADVAQSGLQKKMQQGDVKYQAVTGKLTTAQAPEIAQNAAACPETTEAQKPETTEVIRLIFVNGQWNAELSSPLPLSVPGNDEVRIGSLKAFIDREPDWMQTVLAESFAKNIDTDADAFAALNTALFEDGAFIYVPEGVTVAPLIQILFLSTGSAADSAASCASYPRNLVVLGKQAKASLVIEHVGLNGKPYFNNSVNEFVLAESAQAEATVVLSESAESWHLAATRNVLAPSARLNLSTITLTGGVARHSVSSLLRGERAEVVLNGLDVLRDSTEIYHHTVTEHWVPNSVSNQFYKGILDDAAKSEFNGMVFVAEGANGTDSSQLNKNLLLSENARVWTRPQLQINADDVKCAHGATVGQLDETQLFYLASRGLDRALAQSLLTYGFAEDIINRLENPLLRHYLDGRILDNLRASSDALRRELGA